MADPIDEQTSGSDHSMDNGHPAVGTALFVPMSPPILRSIETTAVARFLKDRERYELEVQAKRVEIPSLQVIPYAASIDRGLLKNLFFLGKFDEIAPAAANTTDLSDSHVQTYIQSIVASDRMKEVIPSVIDNALKGCKMPMEISDADARVSTFVCDFSTVLRLLVTAYFVTQTSKQPSNFYSTKSNHRNFVRRCLGD